MMETTASLYKVPHVRFRADCVYTNNPITGAVRGYGNPQSTFFVETMMDRLAEAIDMDPVEFRLLNSNDPNTVTPQGLVITSCGLKECLETVAAAADRADSKSDANGAGGRGLAFASVPSVHKESGTIRRGVGFAATLNVGGGARIYRSDGCGAIVKMDDFGHVTLITGSTEIGQGSETVLAQIVGETLGVGIDDVAVENSDTDVKPWDVGVHASRTTFIAGNAAHLAAVQARQQIFETAATLLDVSPDELIAQDGMVLVEDDPDRAMPLDKVVRRRHFKEGGKVVIGEGWYDPPTQLVDKSTYKGNISAAYGFGAQMAEVEVDIETGAVRVTRLVCANDVGRAINPMAVEGQIEGGAQMGLGYALTEELIVHRGQVLNPNLLDYRIFTSADMPALETTIIETDDPGGPFGAKGVGEMGGTPTAAAIANAIYDAVGVRLTEVPMTPERVLAALDQQAEA
jgi:xanthine dehydrogenase molybdenum-binding subunit